MMKASIEGKLQRYMSALSVHIAYLERRIAQERKQPLPCTLTLQRLERLRRNAKDRMAKAHKRMEATTAMASA